MITQDMLIFSYIVLLHMYHFWTFYNSSYEIFVHLMWFFFHKLNDSLPPGKTQARDMLKYAVLFYKSRLCMGVHRH